LFFLTYEIGRSPLPGNLADLFWRGIKSLRLYVFRAEIPAADTTAESIEVSHFWLRGIP
jgi:hypothetical protein